MVPNWIFHNFRWNEKEKSHGKNVKKLMKTIRILHLNEKNKNSGRHVFNRVDKWLFWYEK